VGELTDTGRGARRGNRYWHLMSRFVVASAVATGISQLVFLTSYSLGTAPEVATVLAWLAGVIPNFLLNRRTWGGGGRAALRGEILRYGAISVVTAVLAALATSNTEPLAHALFPTTRPAQVIIVYGAYVGTYGVMFVAKFFLIDRLVFTARRRAPAR
jgi:putative flippase GtrA